MDAREAAARLDPFARVGVYLALTKPKQTALLLVTGAGAYALTVPGGIDWPRVVLGMLALWLSISGCTVFNMVLDRDIDAKMARTAGRPLPLGEIRVRSALAWGLGLSLPGLALAWALGPAYGAVVTSGFAIDLGIYTAWLKRRTPHSILVGGVSGGMPALAGRVLALGRPDLVGVLLALGVLLWIPAHILTLAMRRADEYRAAGVPVWPDVYGTGATRLLIAASTVAGAVLLFGTGVLLAIHPVALAALGIAGAIIAATAAAVLVRPSDRHDMLLFKGASIYMAVAFGCLVVGSAF